MFRNGSTQMQTRPDANTSVSAHALSAKSVPGALARAGLWSALAFMLNLAWEIAQVRLYTIWAQADGSTIVWSLFHCSVGDVIIALAMFALAGMLLRRAD